jgi:hypothetical protein
VVSGVAPPELAGAAIEATALVAAARRAGLRPRTTVELLRAAGMPRRDAYRAVHPTDEDGADS